MPSRLIRTLVLVFVLLAAVSISAQEAEAADIPPGVWHRFAWKTDSAFPFSRTVGCPVPSSWPGPYYFCEEYLLAFPWDAPTVPSGFPPFAIEVPNPGARFQVKYIVSATPFVAEQFDIIGGPGEMPDDYRDRAECECFLGMNTVLLRPGRHVLWIIPTTLYSEGSGGSSDVPLDGLGAFRWDVKAVSTPPAVWLTIVGLAFGLARRRIGAR